MIKRAKESMAVQVRAMLEFHSQGIPVFDYGNNIRQMAQEAGVANAFDFQGFVPAISARCSAGAWVPSAGRRFQARRTIFTGPTRK